MGFQFVKNQVHTTRTTTHLQIVFIKPLTCLFQNHATQSSKCFVQILSRICLFKSFSKSALVLNLTKTKTSMKEVKNEDNGICFFVFFFVLGVNMRLAPLNGRQTKEFNMRSKRYTTQRRNNNNTKNVGYSYLMRYFISTSRTFKMETEEC